MTSGAVRAYQACMRKPFGAAPGIFAAKRLMSLGLLGLLLAAAPRSFFRGAG